MSHPSFFRIVFTGLAVALAGCGGAEVEPLPAAPEIIVPTKLTLLNQPAATAAGTPLAQIHVALQDADGATATVVTGEVSIALANSPGGATLSGTTRVMAVDGVAAFNNLRITRAGTGYTLVATAAGLTSATTSAFNVTPAAVTRMAFTTQPSNAAAGADIAPTVQVTLYDSFDNVATTSTAVVTLTSAANTPALFGTTNATVQNGVATFAGISLRSAGTAFRLVASAPNVTPATSAAFNVAASAPVKLVYELPPVFPTEAMELFGVPRVAVKDQYDNTVTSSSIPITLQFASNPLGANFVGTTTVSAVNGVARFDGVAIDRPGSFDIIARATGTMLADALAPGIIIRITPIDVTAGGSHSCAINSANYAFCWGDNASGQVGDGTTTERTRPVPVAGGLQFLSIKAGNAHTCGLTTGRRVFCWGGNTYGQLGDGSTTERHEPVAVTGGLQFRALETGGDHTCALGTVLQASTAHCWGRNTHGQIGDGSTTDRAAPVLVAGVAPRGISADSLHTCSVNWVDFKTFCWGDNTFGQLGDGTTTQRESPTATVDVTDFHFVEVGAKHSCGGITSAALYCWGSNVHGEMASGSTGGADVLRPTLVNGVSAFGLVAGGHTVCRTATVECWGRNAEGQLGDGTTTDRASPVAPTTGQGMQYPPVQIAVGRRHTCAIMSGIFTLYCWGLNDHGQLGDGTTTNRPLPTRVIQ